MEHRDHLVVVRRLIKWMRYQDLLAYVNFDAQVLMADNQLISLFRLKDKKIVAHIVNNLAYQEEVYDCLAQTCRFSDLGRWEN